MHRRAVAASHRGCPMLVNMHRCGKKEPLIFDDCYDFADFVL